MSYYFRFLLSLCAVFAVSTASAVTITIEKNGFADLTGGQITGTGLGSPVPIGTTTDAVSFTAVAGGTYSVDWFHNSGVGGSDFSFTINGAGTGVATVGLGGGQHTMVTGFTSGDTTLTMNSKSITYNANSGQTGSYYLNGIVPAGSIPLNSGPLTKTVIPGWLSVDNLYNLDFNNEDYLFMVASDGSVSAYTNTPQSAEFATFAGSSVSPRSVLAHVSVSATTNMNAVFQALSFQHPIFNTTNFVVSGDEYPYRYGYDMMLAIGNDGRQFPDFGTNIVTSGNAMRGAGFGFSIFDVGPSFVGATSGNDFVFAPRLRFTNDVNAPFTFNGYYFQNTDGFARDSFLRVNGISDHLSGSPPLNVVFVLSIPEPTSLALLAVAAMGLVLVRRRSA